MATNPRNTLSELPGPALISSRRRVKLRRSGSVRGRLLSTAVTLVVLVLVVRYLPPGTRQSPMQHAAVHAAPGALQFSDVQLSKAPDGEALYVDGLVTNMGKAAVRGAIAEVDFLDAQGQVVATLQKPLVGMAHGGTDLVQNEFSRNPIASREMRFFRVAVDQVPVGWNHEVPALKIVAVNAR